jgi:hypothetical protein
VCVIVGLWHCGYGGEIYVGIERPNTRGMGEKPKLNVTYRPTTTYYSPYMYY